MKKLLVLVLVLGLVSVANAGLLQNMKITYAGDVFTVKGLVADYAFQGGIYANDGVFSNPLNLPAAGGLGAAIKYDGYNGIDVSTQAETTGDVKKYVLAGDWFQFTYTGTANKTFDIYDYSVSYDNPVGQLTATPEPMTMTLLGLGGLFFARRKN